MFKKSLAYFTCTIILSAFVSCGGGQGKNAAGYKITFPQSANDSFLYSTEWVYDLKALSEQMPITHAPVYFEPKPADYDFVKQFGADPEKYEVNSEGLRRYIGGKLVQGKPQGAVINFLDNTGCFLADFEEAEDGNPLNDEEAKEVSMKFLVEHGLWKDCFDPQPEINRGIIAHPDGTQAVEDEVQLNYYRKTRDYGSISGTSGISVFIGATGSIKGVRYQYREYTKAAEAKLIPVEEAFNNAMTSGDALWQIENPAQKLNFENVTLRYYVMEDNPDNLVMQPVYIFFGTSTQSSGETEKFGMLVQANKVSG